MVWRQRLDTTTTWTINSTDTVFTVAFSSPNVPHLIFFFNLAIVAMMLCIEVRRFRFYDSFRARLRMLEGNWRRLVAEDLLVLAFKITIFEFNGRRSKRNYTFIFSIILAAWITEIFIHPPANLEHIQSLANFCDTLQIPGLASWFVAAVMLGTFVTVISVTVDIAKNSEGEFTQVGNSSRTNWLG